MRFTKSARLRPATICRIGADDSPCRVALLEVIQLSRQIAGRAAGDAGRGAACAGQVFAMTSRAIQPGGETPAFGHRARRHIGDEARMGIAQLLAVHIHRCLDQPLANGLMRAALVRQPQSFLAQHSGHCLGFHHLDRHGRRQGGVIGGGLCNLRRRHRLGKADHLAGIGLARLGTFARSVLHVAQLPRQVIRIQSGDVGVLRPPLAIGIMAAGAGGDAAHRIAGRNQRRHDGMVVRIPVCGRQYGPRR